MGGRGSTWKLGYSQTRVLLRGSVAASVASEGTLSPAAGTTEGRPRTRDPLPLVHPRPFHI